jgi:protein-tyrosine phosphatase
MLRLCFVCLGNICRSPTAEGVMRHLVREAGLEGSIEVDSAGTIAYHAGEPPDSRAEAAARARGIILTGRARRFERADWDRFDYVLAMDRANFEDLREVAPHDSALAKLFTLRSFDPESPPNAPVPDPYYGGPDGFEKVLDHCHAACRGLLAHVRAKHGL